MTHQETYFLKAMLYVGGLNHSTTKAMLYEKFSSAGPIMYIRICRDIVTRRPLGYAFVNFYLRADAERALNDMNLDVINGCRIHIMWSERDKFLDTSNFIKVYLGGLDEDLTDDMLKDMFEKYGRIKNHMIFRNANGESRGTGLVTFEDHEAAKQALLDLNGENFVERIPVSEYSSQKPLTASMLASLSPEEQKQRFGFDLFPKVYLMYPDRAGKITGMLLELDNSELLHLIEHDESLKARVEEAFVLLQAHSAQQAVTS